MPRMTSDDRRANLVAATVRVINERGFARTRVTDIAAEAGVSVGLLHRYFPTLDDALAAAFAQIAEGDAQATARLAALPPRERLERMTRGCVEDVHLWVSVWIDAWGEALHRPALRETAARYTDRWRRQIAAVLREGDAGGEWRCPDPDDTAARLVACMDGIALHLALHPPAGGVEAARGWVSHLLRAEVGGPDANAEGLMGEG